MKIRLGPSLTGRHEREGMGDTAQNVERIIATLFPMLRITISVPIVEQSVMWRGLTVIKAYRDGNVITAQQNHIVELF